MTAACRHEQQRSCPVTSGGPGGTRRQRARGHWRPRAGRSPPVSAIWPLRVTAGDAARGTGTLRAATGQTSSARARTPSPTLPRCHSNFLTPLRHRRRWRSGVRKQLKTALVTPARPERGGSIRHVRGRSVPSAPASHLPLRPVCPCVRSVRTRAFCPATAPTRPRHVSCAAGRPGPARAGAGPGQGEFGRQVTSGPGLNGHAAA